MNTFALPKTQQLVVFQEVIRSGSIGSAAKELGLTQPAVSKIINDIEAYFGVELVVRKNTGVTLTQAGQVLLSWSESITREMKNMVNEMNSMTDNTVVDISFGFPSLIGFTFMSDMIQKFKEVYPKSQVSMYEAQLSSFLPAIRDGRLDFAIGTLSDEMKLQDLHVEPLLSRSSCWWRISPEHAPAPPHWNRCRTNSGCCHKRIWATTANSSPPCKEMALASKTSLKPTPL